MTCFLTGGNVQVEVGVVSWSTSLRSSMTPMYTQGHTWFQAWNPSNDSLSMTLRQNSRTAQKALSSTLFAWMKMNTEVTIDWYERNMHYTAIVASAPQRDDYNVVMNDINVTFLLVTNRFIDSIAPFTISNKVMEILGGDFVDKTVDDLLQEHAIDEEKEEDAKKKAAADKNKKNGWSPVVQKAHDSNQQWEGYKVVYHDDGTATFSYVDYSAPSPGLMPIAPVYPTIHRRVKLTDDLIRRLNRGDDIRQWLFDNGR